MTEKELRLIEEVRQRNSYRKVRSASNREANKARSKLETKRVHRTKRRVRRLPSSIEDIDLLLRMLLTKKPRRPVKKGATK
jgi:hypothetical protein